VASAAETYGSSAVGILTIIMAGSLGKSIRTIIPAALSTWWERRFGGCCGTSCCGRRRSMGEVDSGGVRTNNELTNGLADSLDIFDGVDDIGGDGGDGGSAGDGGGAGDTADMECLYSGSVDVDTVLRREAFNNGQGTEGTVLADAAPSTTPEREHIASWPPRVTFIFVMSRMIVLPACQFTIAIYAVLPQFSGADANLERVVLLLQCFTPTANLVVVVMQREGKSVGAEGIARNVLFQYLVGILTMTIYTAATLSVVFGSQA